MGRGARFFFFSPSAPAAAPCSLGPSSSLPPAARNTKRGCGGQPTGRAFQWRTRARCVGAASRARCRTTGAEDQEEHDDGDDDRADLELRVVEDGVKVHGWHVWWEVR